jgi:D-glycero-alpha-D-manno-heptose-7-phosphate kinase
VIITRTPFRISFFGGGSDYPAWFDEHGGAVLTSTIDKYCYISARFLPPFFDFRHRVVWSRIEHVVDATEIEHPVVREVIGFLGLESGVEIHHMADLPARAGLGSSSAFTVGLLHSLHALKGAMVTKNHLAREAIHVEQTLLKEHVGVQDQIEVAHGGLNHIELFPGDEYRITPLALQRARVRELESNMMLYFTGFTRLSSDVAGEQIRAVRQNAADIREMVGMVRQGRDILLGTGAIEAFGRLLDESWRLKRGLSPAISTSAIDGIYAAARAGGAIGGKLLGAGGGGFMLIFADPERQDSVRKALTGLLEVPVRFEAGGSHLVFFEDDTARSPSSHMTLSMAKWSGRR